VTTLFQRIAAGVFAFACVSPAAFAAQCSATSGERRVALLELYTSEGCDSCPPVDRWVSDLPVRGFGADRLVVLAFHVDYWDYIGWRDPFGHARYSERQRAANARIGSRTIYTPQLVLNGRDFRGRDTLAARLGEIGKTAPRAAIRVAVTPAPGHFDVAGAWSAGDAATREAQGWLALYENRLASDVRAGENRGKRLQHDFVVRDIVGPFPAGTFTHRFMLDARWKRDDLAVAAFVQDARTGEALQALALPGCGRA
jgi:hypothetical protein